MCTPTLPCFTEFPSRPFSMHLNVLPSLSLSLFFFWCCILEKLNPPISSVLKPGFLSIAKVPRIRFFLINKDSVTSFAG